MRTMGAGQFKAKCLAVLDEVKETGEPVVITKRGKPVARVTALEEPSLEKEPTDSIFGFMRGMATIVEGADLVASEFTDEEWEQMEDEKWARFNEGPSQ